MFVLEELSLLRSVRIIVVILLLIIFLSKALTGGLYESIQRSAVLHTQRISSIINVLKNAPVGTYVEYKLPDDNCKVILSYDSVNFSLKNLSYYLKLIHSPSASIDVFISDVKYRNTKWEIPCKRKLYFVRCFNTVLILDSKDKIKYCKLPTCGVVQKQMILMFNDEVKKYLNKLNNNEKNLITALILAENSFKHYNPDGTVKMTSTGIGLLNMNPEMLLHRNEQGYTSVIKKFDTLYQPEDLCDFKKQIDITLKKIENIKKKISVYTKDIYETPWYDQARYTFLSYRFSLSYFDEYVNTGESWLKTKSRFPSNVRDYVESVIAYMDKLDPHAIKNIFSTTYGDIA